MPLLIMVTQSTAIRDTYLRWIDADKTAKKAREQIPESRNVNGVGNISPKRMWRIRDMLEKIIHV